MQSSPSGLRGRSTEEAYSEAASSTAPDAVSHECSQWGERKNTSAGWEVWVSVTSTNHDSQLRQMSSRRPQPSILEMRISMAAAVGGVPARTSSAATAASRRENDWYIDGR
jgi:hypothetical protein